MTWEVLLEVQWTVGAREAEGSLQAGRGEGLREGGTGQRMGQRGTRNEGEEGNDSRAGVRFSGSDKSCILKC